MRYNLEQLADMGNWVSPRLGIRLELHDDGLTVIRPDGAPFLTYAELDAARVQAEQERLEATAQAEQERQRAEQLVAQLRALGIEPEGKINRWAASTAV